jgi:hypothetical protein
VGGVDPQFEEFVFGDEQSGALGCGVERLIAEVAIIEGADEDPVEGLIWAVLSNPGLFQSGALTAAAIGRSLRITLQVRYPPLLGSEFCNLVADVPYLLPWLVLQFTTKTPGKLKWPTGSAPLPKGMGRMS